MSENMRNQFEAWAKSYSKDVRLDRGNHGAYSSGITHSLYCAWAASRAALVIELPNRYDEKYQEYFDDVEGGLFNESKYLADVKSTLEAAGMKVTP
jgi:hypothetical protein